MEKGKGETVGSSPGAPEREEHTSPYQTLVLTVLRYHFLEILRKNICKNKLDKQTKLDNFAYR